MLKKVTATLKTGLMIDLASEMAIVSIYTGQIILCDDRTAIATRDEYGDHSQNEAQLKAFLVEVQKLGYFDITTEND